MRPSAPKPAPSPRQPLIRVIDCHLAYQSAEGFRYLVLKRSTDALYAGMWRMVGGKIEGGETAWQTALREVKEETGLVPSTLYTVPYVNRFYEWEHDRLNDIPVFVGLTDQTTLTLNQEHSAYEWLAIEDALARLAWPGQREGLNAANELLCCQPELRAGLRIAIHET